MPTKFRLVKAMVFPIVMYGCESWTIKKAEHWWIDAFKLWCWRRLLRVPWTARRSNQSILKEISPEYSSEGLMLKLKLQYFGHLIRRTDSLEKTLMLGKMEGGRRRGRQRMRWLDGVTTWWAWVCVGSRSWWWIGKPGMLQSVGSQKAQHNWVTELNWTVALVINSFPSTLEKKNLALGNSLVVWGLGLCALIAKGWGGQSLVGELRSCKPLVWQKKKKKKKDLAVDHTLLLSRAPVSISHLFL